MRTASLAYVGSMVHQMRRFFYLVTVAFGASALACGCGGGGGGSPAPAFAAPAPTPTPAPTATPGGPLTPSQSTTALTLAGQPSTVVLNEPGYNGNVLADASACANIASITPTLTTAPATFTITALGAGSCAIGFSDFFGQHASVQVGVTITQGTIK